MSGMYLQFPSGGVFVPPGPDSFLIATEIVGLLQTGEPWVKLVTDAGVSTWTALERDDFGSLSLIGYMEFNGNTGVITPEEHSA